MAKGLVCACHYYLNLEGCHHSDKPNTTSTLNGKWPSDTWFQRARALKLKREAAEIEALNAQTRQL